MALRTDWIADVDDTDHLQFFCPSCYRMALKHFLKSSKEDSVVFVLECPFCDVFGFFRVKVTKSVWKQKSFFGWGINYDGFDLTFSCPDCHNHAVVRFEKVDGDVFYFRLVCSSCDISGTRKIYAREGIPIVYKGMKKIKELMERKYGKNFKYEDIFPEISRMRRKE